MASLLQDGIDWYKDAMTKGDPRVADWFLMQEFYVTFLISIGYYLSIPLGMWIMKDRAPLHVKPLAAIYNLAMVFLSAYMFYEMWIPTFALGCRFESMCCPVDYSDNPYAIRAAKAVWWYYFSKAIEFLDTWFMIAGKKFNQVTFLHCYHHGTMLSIWWIGAKYVGGGNSVVPAGTNCFVHVVMYLYYFLSAIGVRVWWKKYVTQLQLAQFFIMLGFAVTGFVIDCDYPRWMAYALAAYMLSLIVLFMNFYRHAYNKSQEEKKKKKAQ